MILRYLYETTGREGSSSYFNMIRLSEGGAGGDEEEQWVCKSGLGQAENLNELPTSYTFQVRCLCARADRSPPHSHLHTITPRPAPDDYLHLPWPGGTGHPRSGEVYVSAGTRS